MAGLLKKVVRWFSNPPTEIDCEEPTETHVEQPTGQLPVDALKEWTGKTKATIIYDSTADEFTADGVFNKVEGKENIAVVGFTTDGDVFGGFYSRAVLWQNEELYDPNIFAFSFESHGRCKTPQRFVGKERRSIGAFVGLCKNNRNGFFQFWVVGGGGFFLGNERSDSFFCYISNVFKGLEDTTLTGISIDWSNPLYHHCTRLVAIQLE